jgi:CspA family cold shock protein
LNARQKRLFEEARKRNPDLKIPEQETLNPEWSEADLALVKQGVGDKTTRPVSGQESVPGDEPPQPHAGSVVTYFEGKGFGFLRPDDGGRDIFFHVSRLVEGDATELRPGTRVTFELGMDRTGKIAATAVRIPPPA